MNDLPAGWRLVPLESVIDEGPTNGFSPQSTGKGKGPLALKLTATTSGSLRLDSAAVKHLDEPVPDESKAWLEPGDLLVQRANTLEYVGAAAIYEGPRKTYVYPDLMMRVRIREESTRQFLWRFLNSDGARSYFRENATGTAGNMPKINGATLRSLLVPLPPLDVQRRIVAKLDSLLAQTRAAREQLEAVPALVEKYRQSVLAAAFRGDLTAEWRKKNPNVEPASKLLERIRAERRKKWEEAELAKMKAKGKVPKDDTWKAKYVEPEPVDARGLPELPPTWCWASFDELVSESLYGPRFGADDYVRDGIPTIRTTDMDAHGAIRFADPPRVSVSEAQLDSLGLQHHDLLVTRTGSIGRCALYEGRLGRALPSAYLIRFRMVLPLVSANFALKFLLSPRAQHAMGLGATAVTQSNINARTLGRISVPLAPLREQEVLCQRVDTQLAAVDNLGEVADREVSLLERALLARAFKGEFA